MGLVLLLTVCVQPAHAQQRKDCNFEFPGLFRDYPRLREATLQTPTRNPDNWRGGWNYEYILDVARDTLRNFRRDENLFKDFAKICVFTLGGGGWWDCRWGCRHCSHVESPRRNHPPTNLLQH